MGFTYVPLVPGWDLTVANLARVPVVAAALGPVAGLGARGSWPSHFSVIVQGLAQIFVAGPPVVAAAMGESPDKEELRRAHGRRRPRRDRQRGRHEDDALDQLKRFLSYLPGQRLGRCRRSLPQLTRRPAQRGAPVDRARDRRKPYKVRRILEAVFDEARCSTRAPLRRLPGDRARPGSAAGPSACSPPTPATTAAE